MALISKSQFKLSPKAEAYLAHAAIVFLTAFVATFGGSAVVANHSLSVSALAGGVVAAVSAGISAVAHWALGLLSEPSAPPAH